MQIQMRVLRKMSGGTEPGVRVPLRPRVLSKTPCGLGPVGTSSDLVKKSFDQLTPVSWLISKMTVRSLTIENWPVQSLSLRRSLEEQFWVAGFQRHQVTVCLSYYSSALQFPIPGPCHPSSLPFHVFLGGWLAQIPIYKALPNQIQPPSTFSSRINQDSDYCLTSVLILKQKHP